MRAVLAKKPDESGHPTGEVYSVGTAAVIARMAKAPDGGVQAIIQGVARVTLQQLQQQDPWLRVRAERLRDVSTPGLEMEGLTRAASSLFQRAVGLAENVPQAMALMVAGLQDPSHMADLIAANLNIKPEERQAALEATDIAARRAIA